MTPHTATKTTGAHNLKRYAVQQSLEGAHRDRSIIPGVTGEQGALFDNAPGVEDSLAWCVAQARLEELTT